MDIIIVGAGPAGSSVAYEATENKEHNVVLIDKRMVVGHPPQCAGGISELLFESELPDLYKKVPKRLILNKPSRVSLRSPNEEAIIESHSVGRDSFALIVDRARFDQWLFFRAVDTGVRCMRGKVTAVTASKEGVDVYLDKVKYKADIVVGADGARSMVGRWSGMVNHISPTDMHYGYQETINMPDYPEDMITMWFNTLYAPGGYVWAFPEGGGRVRLGVGVPLNVGRGPYDRLKVFKQRNNDYDYTGEVLTKIAGLLSTRPPMQSCVNKFGNVALVGCAGAHTSSLHGGGILHAMIAGKGLGKTIAEERPLKEYDARWKERLGKRLGMHYKLKNMISCYSNDDLDRMFRILGSFGLRSRNADKEILRFVGHVFKKDPLLIPYFVASML